MEEDDKKKSRVVRGTAALTAKEIFGSILGVFYLVVSARELGVEGMAVVSVLTMVYTLFQLFLLLAIPTAFQKFIAENLGRGDEDAVKRLMRTALMVTLVTGIIGAFASFTVAPLIASTFFEGRYVAAFQLVSLAVATSIASNVLTTIFLAFQLYEKYSIITFAGATSGQLISLMFILLNYGPPAFVAFWIVQNVLVVILLTAARPKVKATSKAYPIRPLLSYSFPLFLSTFVSYLGSGVFIRVLILNKLSSADLGNYETAIRSVGAPKTYHSTFLASFFPHLSKVYGEKGNEEVGHNIDWAVRLLSFIFSPIIVGLGLLAEPTFFILFGREYGEAVPIVIILLTFALANFLLSPFTQGMQALGYTKRMFHIQFVSTTIAILGSLVLAELGVVGVAAGAESLGLASSLLNFYFFRKYVKPEIYWGKIGSFLLASLAMVPPVYLSTLVLPRYRYLPLQIAIGAGVYVAVIRTFKLVEKKDLDVIASIFPTRLQRIVLKLFS
ncbi:MAG: oligosaccharide flippase family protein [Candidatus Bathyarchaeota archaeon]